MTNKLRVLVIDDNNETRHIVEQVLVPHGYMVDIATSAIEGLRKALTEVYDMVMVSLEMPQISGFELLREIRNFDNMVPIIILTAQKVENISLEVLRLGVHDYVKKPLETEELMDAVENALCLPQLQTQRRELFTRNIIQTNQRLEQRIQNLNALYKISKSITSLMEPNKILERIVDAVLDVLDGQECTLLLVDPKTGKIQNELHKHRTNTPEQQATDDAALPEDLTETVLSVPLQVGDMVVGILSLTKRISGQFTSHDAQSLRMLADYAAIAIHNVQLMEQLKKSQEQEKQRLRGLFERYVAPSVVKELLKHPDNVKLGGSLQAVTVLFADVRGFSTFSGRTSPETLVKLLNHYMTVATEAILTEEGTLDKFLGDAVMALFNAPVPQSDHPLRALRAAWVLRESVVQLHVRLPSEHHLLFGIGVGVGQALVGNIGTSKLMNFTAIGDSVNKVKRLQESAKGGQILIAEETYQLVKEHIKVNYLGDVHLKGQSHPEPVYEVLAVESKRS